ncbi:MAG: flgH [Phycisphaerales bacterium]|nr:flgH [Phycisphaerales bacterium]
MRNRKKRITAKAAFLSIACVSGALALGQAAPQTQQDPAEVRPSPHPDRTSVKPANNNAAAQAGMMMSRTGGSLLKASLAAPPDPGQAKLSQVSFYAVPEKEPKTLKKHDLVTIIIREESQMDSKATTDLTKDAELKAAVNQMIKLKLSSASIYGLQTPAAAPAVDFTGNRTFKGDGEVKRDDSLTARITAEILDVKPNGTLVLQARKRIKHDEEEQQFILTGTCRAEDVNADNTLLSTQLYDLELQKNTKGSVRSATERGRLPKLLDFINPF